MGLSFSNDSLQLLSAPIKILKVPLGCRVMGSVMRDKQSGSRHAEQWGGFSSREGEGTSCPLEMRCTAYSVRRGKQVS